MISNGDISLSTIQMLHLAVGGLFLAAAALFYFSKQLPQAKDDSEFLKAPKALRALLFMTLSLVLCFYLILISIEENQTMKQFKSTILSLIVVVVTLLISNKLAVKDKDSWGAMQYP